MASTVSCMAPFIVASALSGCVMPTYVDNNNPCAPVVVQDQNYGTTRSVQSALAEANKSGNFNNGPYVTSSTNAAAVGMVVKRRPNNPACK